MEPILAYLFGAASFLPHGYCLLWRPDLVAMHVIGDGLTALAYFLIPGSILWFLHRRRDLEPAHYRMAALFVAFILACALSHLAGLLTLWFPYYGLQGLIKVATALISLTTAAFIWRLMPSLLALPSPRELAVANGRLLAEIAAKEEALAQLEAARNGLEQKVAERTQELTRANQRFELALANSNIVMFQQDPDLHYVWLHNPPEGMIVDEVIGKTDADILPAQSVGPIEELKREAMETGERRERELHVDFSEGARWYDLRVEPLAEGLEKGVICVAIDITPRKQTEEQLKLVMHELAHRVKNIFTVVQSIMNQTARRAKDIGEFTTAFSERLGALSRGHDQLARVQWRSASLHDVVGAVVGPLIDADPAKVSAEGSARLRVNGPAIELDSSQVQNLALAFHELTTNSLKYGALAVEGGWIDLHWWIDQTPDGPVARLEWQEIGGPPVTPPERTGFGRMMVETLLPHSLGGSAQLDFAPDGLVWRLDMPLR
jgi:PAS domain S-box-containing protein